MSETNIEWANRTLNAIVSGCQRTSPGCVHCYAEGMAKRLAAMGQEAYKWRNANDKSLFYKWYW